MFLTNFSSCAVMMNGSQQRIFISGGPSDGITKVRTPDGTFDIENGSGSIMLTRSRSDIPVKITCPNGASKQGIIPTHFDWLKGGAGNIFNAGIGWFVDPFTEDAFVIKNLSLIDFCKES